MKCVKDGKIISRCRVESRKFLRLFYLFEEFEGFETAFDVVIQEFAKDRFEFFADRVRDLDALHLIERQRAYMLDKFYRARHESEGAHL